MTNEDEIRIEVDGKLVSCARGATLLSVILSHRMAIETACGGRGICHLCRLTVTRGREHLPPPNNIEKKALGNVLIARGMRLSCQIQAVDGLAVELPPYETPEQRRERIRRACMRKKSPP